MVGVKERGETVFSTDGIEDRLNFGGLADLAPAREVPSIGKTAALLGFDGLDTAVLALEEDAGSVGLIDEGQTSSVGAEAGVGSNELGFFHFQEGSDGRDLFFGDFDVAGPAAAVGAALAKIFRGIFLGHWIQ